MESKPSCCEFAFTPWTVTDGQPVLADDLDWDQPLTWNRHAKETGGRHRVWCTVDPFGDLSSVMHDRHGSRLAINAGEGANGAIYPEEAIVDDDWGCRSLTLLDCTHRMLRLIDRTPWLDWLLVTEHPHRIAHAWRPGDCTGLLCLAAAVDGVVCPHDACDAESGVRVVHRGNAWLGVRVYDQADADRLVPELVKHHQLVPVVFMHYRMAGPVLFGEHLPVYDFRPTYPHWRVMHPDSDGRPILLQPGICWVLAEGGERPAHPNWIRECRRDCRDFGVPLWFESWGEWLPIDDYRPDLHGSADDHLHGWIYSDGSTNADRSRHELPTSTFRVGRTRTGHLVDEEALRQLPTAEVVS